MTRRAGRIWGRALLVLLIVSGPIAASAHRSGCHRWHSCPSDTGSYICGDLGYCSQCPDNPYCQGGQPRPAAQPAPVPSQPSSGQADTYLVKRVIDGDTLELTTGERIRLIGVDTPETKDPRNPVQYFGRRGNSVHTADGGGEAGPVGIRLGAPGQVAVFDEVVLPPGARARRHARRLGAWIGV